MRPVEDLPPLDDPQCYKDVWRQLAFSSLLEEDPLKKLLTEDFAALSTAFDNTKLQEGWSWRNVTIAHDLAVLLIDAKGRLIPDQLKRAIQLLEENLYPFSLEAYHDVRARKHYLAVLKNLQNNKECQRAFDRISRPAQNAIAEKLIRETLFLKATAPVTDTLTRQAVLAALLTTLRQNVGSCFATAPAILVHTTMPLKFLYDIASLLSQGSLTRIINGNEYSMPLSPSSGAGDLLRPVLLSSLGNDPWKTLAASPGLLKALESAELFAEGCPELEKEQKCLEWLLEGSLTEISNAPFAFITPEALLRHILSRHFGLSEEEIQQERPIELLPNPFHVAPKERGSRAALITKFWNTFETARRTFVAMTDNPLLKAWEFTLASFSESRLDFTKWNLYTSLGFAAEEKEGIGQCLYEGLSELVGSLESEAKEYESKYDHVVSGAISLEGRMRRATSQADADWLASEYQMRKMELMRLGVERDNAYDKARQLSSLLPVLGTFYDQKCREYFQEIYDAQMHEVAVEFYDDSPAGFRLLYKHGRSNPAQWTLIYTPAEFLEALTAFFTATENELLHLPETKGLSREISSLLTKVLLQLKRPEFLETAFYRLALANHERPPKDPLHHLDQIKRKPWAYISGGTMEALASTYFEKGFKLKEKTVWVERPEELLAFFIDSLRESATFVQQKQSVDPEASLLAFSPTHAFVLKAKWHPLKDALDSSTYAYTWIKDELIFPQQRFLSTIHLDRRSLEFLTDKIAEVIPHDYRALFRHVTGKFSLAMSPSEFRSHILSELHYERWMQGHQRQLAEAIDALLYQLLPLFPEHALKERLLRLFDAMDLSVSIKADLRNALEKMPIRKFQLLSAADLERIATTLLMLAFEKTKDNRPWHRLLRKAMSDLGYAYPQPLLVADTNWVKNVFGFVVNPGTDKLDFWRFDDEGGSGRPMTVWQDYLNGKDRKDFGFFLL